MRREEDRSRTAHPPCPSPPVRRRNGEFVPQARARAAPRGGGARARDGRAHRRQAGHRPPPLPQSSGGIAVTLAAINLVGCDDDDKETLAAGRHRRRHVRRPDRRRSGRRLREARRRRVHLRRADAPRRSGRSVGEGESRDGAASFARFLGGDPSAPRPTSSTASAATTTRTTSSSRATRRSPCSPTRRRRRTRSDPLNFDEMKRTRDIINQLSPPDADRLRLHSVVVPNVGTGRSRRSSTACRRARRRWTSPRGRSTRRTAPNGTGWFLDDPELGIPVIEQARELGVKTICAHKGLPLFGFDRAHASPRDIGVVAKAYPDMNFVVYHSGWYPGHARGPVRRRRTPQGVDVLVKSLLDNGVQPNTNVYAELGSTWRNIMSDPTQAAHVLGKLLKYCGEDNVLWGTDCIWTGSPQPQIAAFRAFKMDPQFAQQYGYPDADRRREAQDLRPERRAPLRRRSRRRGRAASMATRSKGSARPGATSRATRTRPRYALAAPRPRGHAALVRRARRPLAARMTTARRRHRGRGHTTDGERCRSSRQRRTHHLSRPASIDQRSLCSACWTRTCPLRPQW